MSNPFQIAYDNSKRKLKHHKSFDKFLWIISFGIFNNRENINKYLENLREKEEDYKRYEELIKKVEYLTENDKDFTVENIRLGKEIYSDISVVGREDYGPNWDILRQEILERDDFTCQEADGYCMGALQVHHIKPLSKGGTNNKNNLITLCLYHHSLQHEHMKNQI
jgi:Restriction endonuclease